MNAFYLYLAAFLVAFSHFLPLCAQEAQTKNKKAAKYYQEARVMVNQRKFDQAAELLELAVEKDTGFVQAHLELGSIYKLLLKQDKAKEHFFKAARLAPDSKELTGAYFVVGEYLFNEGNYEEASKYFEKVIKFNPTQKGVMDRARQYQQNARFAIEAKKNPINFKPTLMSTAINSFYMQAFPVVTADGQSLIYSMRPGVRPQDNEDIVISKNENGTWSAPQSISPKINTKYNEGACTISGDGRTLVFASCRRPESISEGCDLYVSYKEGDDWSAPVNMGPKVNSAKWESEPSISADGKTIYFTSDRSGGYGKDDIWVTKKNEAGEWTPAKNVGLPVNTAGRDVSPFLHANGSTLFFSSDTHPGLGGFDIFSTTLNDSIPSQPVNLGYPLNTQVNDVSMFITADGSKGYYSVDQREEGGMNYTRAFLYEFEVPAELHRFVKNNTYAKGGVYETGTKTPLSASVELIDLATGKVLQSVSSDPKNGNYIVVLTEGNQYGLYVSKDGYLFKSLTFDYRNSTKFDPTFLDIYLEPLKTGAGIVLNNLFFASNSYQLDPKSKTELNKIIAFLKKNPSVKIEFGGYTDNVGSDQDNMLLSENRAKSVYNYLIESGVSSARLRYKGYGESKPIETNETETGRLRNRRIEFKIL